jgi:hypothetical protein
VANWLVKIGLIQTAAIPTGIIQDLVDVFAGLVGMLSRHEEDAN